MTKPATSQVAPPKGTRDLYPSEMLRQHYITRLWRDTAIRHGFEEINGPTFEMLELYTRKSGEGIVSELFRFRREGGQDDYALRPEFTPTLARMYAAKAASLPSPTKWFSIGPYFRAEKPQRGRLREFLQWNVDVLGLPGDPVAPNHAATDCRVKAAQHNADLWCVMADCLTALGLTDKVVQFACNDRDLVEELLRRHCKLEDSQSWRDKAFALLDKRSKTPPEQFQEQASGLGLDLGAFDNDEDLKFLADVQVIAWKREHEWMEVLGRSIASFNQRYRKDSDPSTDETWLRFDPSIVRGLAYYTGTVFEVIAEGERAIAGGGRYDNLIELFGGPPTPAVGFGMGDVVLGLLLEDKGLLPTGVELLDALSRPGASLRPEAFVVAGSDDEDALIEPLLANLRRGIEREGFDGKPWAADRYAVRPMHARRSYKTTRNLKKLLGDAERQFARFAVILHGPDKVELRDMATRQDLTPNLVPAWGDDASRKDAASFSVDPASPIYVGGALARCLSGASG
ncbi:MAG: ATP phosphoribosyltransferase regulatory subunit [Phycisphaeraceae bacterium]|nr:ATP phosphoribosyltransferase regulatory subunit [Phycisphaeraceae bacterium]